MHGLNFFIRAYPDTSKEKLEVGVGKQKKDADVNRQPSFKSITAGPAKAAAHNSSLPEHPTNASSQRTDLIFSDYAPLPSDQRKPLGNDQKQITQPHISALTKTKAALETGLNVTRPELMQIKGNKDHAAAYKLWRDSKPGSPNYDKISKAGKEGLMNLAKQSKQEGNAMFQALQGTELEKFFCPFSGCFRDPNTGVAAGLEQLMKKDGTPVLNDQGKPVLSLVFPGTGRGAAWRAQLKTNAQQFLGSGGVPAAHQQSEGLATHLKAKFADAKQLTLTGHSLGGGIANYVGIKQDIPSTCYNPAALGGACLKNLKDQPNLDERIKKQSIIRIKRDPVSSPKMQVRLATLVFLFMGKKIATPQSLGTTYQASFADLPPEHRNCFSAHREIALSSLYGLTSDT